jgi:hypothetical protein
MCMQRMSFVELCLITVRVMVFLWNWRHLKKRMNSNKHNAIPLTDTQTIPNERILSLNNDLCRNYAGDIKAVNHIGEITEMIELGAVGI